MAGLPSVQRRLWGLYGLINLLLALGLALPLAGILSHFLRLSLAGILLLWGIIILLEALLTLALLPRLRSWLRRKDLERTGR